jgi:hypothetical protein
MSVEDRQPADLGWLTTRVSSSGQKALMVGTMSLILYKANLQ